MAALVVELDKREAAETVAATRSTNGGIVAPALVGASFGRLKSSKRAFTAAAFAAT